jgi:hypothetical protein
VAPSNGQQVDSTSASSSLTGSIPDASNEGEHAGEIRHSGYFSSWRVCLPDVMGGTCHPGKGMSVSPASITHSASSPGLTR